MKQQVGGITIIEDPNIMDGKVFLFPPVTITHHENLTTGEACDIWEWNPKAGAIITGVKP